MACCIASEREDVMMIRGSRSLGAILICGVEGVYHFGECVLGAQFLLLGRSKSPMLLLYVVSRIINLETLNSENIEITITRMISIIILPVLEV